MKKIMLLLLLVPGLCWASCDQAKIYEADEILFETECNSSKLKGCMIKAFTKEGREYVGIRVSNSGTKVVQVYKWLDTPNSESATYWDASRVARLTNLSSQYPGRVTKAEYWKLDKSLKITVRNFRKDKQLLSAQMKCK